MTIAYLYKWTHLLSNKWYIGSRTKKECHPNDGYICSSKIVKPMILEDKTNWKREILVIGNPTYIRELEATLLTIISADTDPMSFNQHNGNGKFSTTGRQPHNKGTKMSESQKKKISNSKIGKAGIIPTTTTRKKLSDSKKGSKNPMYGKRAWNNGVHDVVHSTESNIKRSLALKGRSRPIEVIEKIKQTKAVNKAAKINTVVETLMYTNPENPYNTDNLQ